MFKLMTICLFALLALASAKPHLLTTGISYATPAVAGGPIAAVGSILGPVGAALGPVAAVGSIAAPITSAIFRPVFGNAGAYYPAYSAPHLGYGSYATYPYYGATYFVRR